MLFIGASTRSTERRKSDNDDPERRIKMHNGRLPDNFA